MGTSRASTRWFGVLLVLAFGLGMALTLCGAGMLVVRLGDGLARTTRLQGGLASRTAAALPLVTALGVVCLGTVLALRGAAAV